MGRGRWVRLLFLTSIWFLFSLVATAQSKSSVFRMPTKPNSNVSDESQWLSAEERLAWEKQLEVWQSNDGVDIYLVILRDLHNTPAEHVTRQIATQWGARDLHGVVLYVPGGSGPFLWWDGEILETVKMDPRARREMIARMEKRSKSQATERDRVSAAIHELSDSMRVINAQYKQMKFMRDKWNDTAYDHWSASRVNRRTKIIIVVAVAVFSISFLAWLVRRTTRNSKKFYFPRTSAQRRFGAAHAGGSGATTSLKS